MAAEDAPAYFTAVRQIVCPLSQQVYQPRYPAKPQKPSHAECLAEVIPR
jgi:hypothetical protein